MTCKIEILVSRSKILFEHIYAHLFADSLTSAALALQWQNCFFTEKVY